MKIDFKNYNLEEFNLNTGLIAGENCILVTPKVIGVKWTQENKIFRSSIWDVRGNLVSASFSKFTNWGESPEEFPVPNSLKNCTVVEKMDGSLLSVTKYKGQYILRTRGTFDAHAMENGHELEIFKEKILNKLENIPKVYCF